MNLIKTKPSKTLYLNPIQTPPLFGRLQYFNFKKSKLLNLVDHIFCYTQNLRRSEKIIFFIFLRFLAFCHIKHQIN